MRREIRFLIQSKGLSINECGEMTNSSRHDDYAAPEVETFNEIFHFARHPSRSLHKSHIQLSTNHIGLHSIRNNFHSVRGSLNFGATNNVLPIPEAPLMSLIFCINSELISPCKQFATAHADAGRRTE